MIRLIAYYFAGLFAEMKDFSLAYKLKRFAPFFIAAFIAGFSQRATLPDLSLSASHLEHQERVMASVQEVDAIYIQDSLKQSIYNY